MGSKSEKNWRIQGQSEVIVMSSNRIELQWEVTALLVSLLWSGSISLYSLSEPL